MGLTRLESKDFITMNVVEKTDRDVFLPLAKLVVGLANGIDKRK